MAVILFVAVLYTAFSLAVLVALDVTGIAVLRIAVLPAILWVMAGGIFVFIRLILYAPDE